MTRSSGLRLALVALLSLPLSAPAQIRIKDLTTLDGARPNHLFGYGLVVGLAGTGSRNLFTQQTAADMLQRLNQTARIFNQSPADPVIKSTNISAVMVTAEIGPFNRVGTKIDVQVASIDDSTSLQGGILIQTPLYGADGQVYAVAQGALTIGGFIVSGQAATIQKNHPTVGRVVNGGLVEKEALGEVVCKGRSRFLLKDPDWNTARKIARVLNEFSAGCAVAEDAGAVIVCIPGPPGCSPVGFLGELGLLEIKPDATARVVINERTGTVVVGQDVKLAATAVAHGNLTIVISETPEVSQPEPFGRGRTVVVPRTSAEFTEQPALLNVVPRTSTVADLARALNALGVTPRDLISIFQALKRAGALYAEIELL